MSTPKFVPFSDPGQGDGCCVVKTAHGSAGSNLLLVAFRRGGEYHYIKSVVNSSTLPQTTPYRNFRYVRTSNINYMVGDRLSCGSIICAAPLIRGNTTSVSVEEIPRITVEGNITWMRDLMACNGTPVSRGMRRMTLFDIGRGKIEVASSIFDDQPQSLLGSVTGLAMSPKIALASSYNGLHVVDMRTSTVSSTIPSCENQNNSVVAGCNAFFNVSHCIFGDDSSTVSIKPVAHGIWKIIPSEGYNKCINDSFAWHPARGPLAVVVSRDSLLSSSYTSIYLIDPRRHTVMEVPGTTIFDDACRFWTMRVHSHSFYPGHAAGQPYIGAISHNTGVPSFLTL